MRFFAISDLHVDYRENAAWVADLSRFDFREDVLLLPGDLTDILPLLAHTLDALARRFHKVAFVPGNHELWVCRDAPNITSVQKLARVRRAAEDAGVMMQPFTINDVTVVPFLSWYDYSFGTPTPQLRELWMDFHACRWPEFASDAEVAAWFASFDPPPSAIDGRMIISLSHFVPRRELVPGNTPSHVPVLAPVLGSADLDRRIRAAGATLHIYGHSHINRRIQIDGVTYANNALGYPHEHFTYRRLQCVHEA